MAKRKAAPPREKFEIKTWCAGIGFDYNACNMDDILAFRKLFGLDGDCESNGYATSDDICNHTANRIMENQREIKDWRDVLMRLFPKVLNTKYYLNMDDSAIMLLRERARSRMTERTEISE